jgi:hypothetical protein
MIFAAPWVLLGLTALPGLYLLLRLTPPAARRIAFPPLALLRGLAPAERTARRMPLWLVLLRIMAAALVILGLAGPALHPPPALPGKGPVLLVIDNGWAAAAHWPALMDAAKQNIGAARQAGRGIAVLTTARDANGAAPEIQGVMTAARATQLVDALQPVPWPVDRPAAAAALQNAAEATRIYLADGITDGPGFAGFLNTVHPTRIITAPRASLLLPPSFNAGRLVAHIAGSGGGLAGGSLAGAGQAVLAETASGGVLAQTGFTKSGDAIIDLPLPLAGQVAKLVLVGPASAGGVFLLTGGSQARLIGLAAGSNAADAPFLGALFFASRALPAASAVVRGDLEALIADKADVIVLADVALTPAQRQISARWIAAGGEMIRFAGPLTADMPDGLAPDGLLAGDRRLGGALTWTRPQGLAQFPIASPLAGITVSATATVSRQILADPTRLDSSTVWAALADGTPLVLGKTMGKGLLVSVLTTANADWSNLALTGMYPAMLGRLILLGHGVPVQRDVMLPMQSALDAFGKLRPPVVGAPGISAGEAEPMIVSPAHPPGFYGTGAAGLALNLGGHIAIPVAARLPGAEMAGSLPPPVDFGAGLLAAAIWLLAFDLLVSLRLRGRLTMWRGLAGFAIIAIAIHVAPARAQGVTNSTPVGAIPQAALQTQLAYIRTGDPSTDQISADALNYLSALVSARTSAQLGPAAGVSPAADNIDLYPLIYWPVPPGTTAPSEAVCARLIDYMLHGGLLLIDSQGADAGAAGSAAGFAPGATAALNRATACLDLPPLEPLTTANAIAHSFYIVPSFAGKFVGDPVLIANAAARDADGVTPVIIGQNDWAGAWARDQSGNPEQTPLPNGEDQRVIADRFGTNLVIYALTGDYKSDQSRLPAFFNKFAK